MTNYASFEAALAAVMALEGFIAHRMGDKLSCRPEPGKSRDTVAVDYAQLIASGAGYKWRTALITSESDVTVNQDGNEACTLTACSLALPVIDETPEGYHKVITTVSGPDLYYPWIESLEISTARDGSDCEPVDAAKQPCQAQDAVWFRKTARIVMGVESGLSQALGAWSRANEGDHFSVSIEMPDGQGGWSPIPTPDGGTVRFADKIVIHGSSPMPTPYPPQASPNLSWVPQGLAVRLDFYKKAVNDAELVNERGPYIDIDFILWRARVQ